MLSSEILVTKYMEMHFGNMHAMHGKIVKNLFRLAYEELEERRGNLKFQVPDDVSLAVDDMSYIWDSFRQEVRRRLPAVVRLGGSIPSFDKLLEDQRPEFITRWLMFRYIQAL